MQGQLSEIDIRSILQLIELGQRTGELFVEAYPAHVYSNGVSIQDGHSAGQSWFVFFLNGQIIYTAGTDSNLSRLRDYLRRYQADTALETVAVPSIAGINAPEYGYLWALLENHILTPAQGRSIIKSMVHETLFDLLSLHQGSFVFELGNPLAPQLTTWEIAPLVAKIMKQVQEWKQFYPHIQSPDQCPVIAAVSSLQQALPEATFASLEHYTDGKTSLRQVARYLNRDILTVARAIYPYVQQGWIQLTYSGIAEDEAESLKPRSLDQWSVGKPPKIVCIDDSTTIGQTVVAILEQHGYEASAIENPLAALSLVFQLKPALILCDIAMPELDGYEICAMLRKSTAFRQTPIVMLTGKEGFIDRVKAKMVGATDYLTKPFGENELLMLLERYVKPGPVEPTTMNETIRTLENGVEMNLT